MKRIRHLTRKLAALLAAFSLLVVLGYLLLFTSVGNRLTAPLIEKGLSAVFSTPVYIDSFVLRHNHFRLLIHDKHQNRFSTQGSYSLLTLQGFGYYRIRFDRPSGINPLPTPLYGSGSYSGGYALLNIQGEAEGIGGELIYKTTFDHLSVDSIRLHLRHIDVQSLLHLFDYPSITSSALDANVTLTGLVERKVQGDITLQTRTTSYSPTPIIESDSDTSHDLASLLGDKDGNVRHFTLNVTSNLSMDEAGIAEQILGIHLRGPLDIHASVTGDQRDLSVDADTNLANSRSSLTLTFQRLQPKQLRITMKHAQVETLFHFLAQEAPITGIADLSANLRPTGGRVDLSLNHGKTCPEILKQEYELTQPPIAFDAKLSALFSPKGVHYQGSFRSDLSRMEISGTTAHEQMLRELLSSLR